MQVIAVRFFASDIKPNWISKGDNTTLGGGLKFLFFSFLFSQNAAGVCPLRPGFSSWT